MVCVSEASPCLDLGKGSVGDRPAESNMLTLEILFPFQLFHRSSKDLTYQHLIQYSETKNHIIRGQRQPLCVCILLVEG
jgi:hypothetical protein